MADLVARVFLKFSPMLSSLRRVPWMGQVAHRISHSVLAADRVAWVQVRSGPGGGLWLKLYPRTGRNYYEGCAEPKLQEVMGKYLRPGMVFYDLGANLGFFSLLAARLVGKSGKVLAFEADPEGVQRLREHVEKNRLQNIRVIQGAVWSSTGSVAFNRADESRSPDRGVGRVASSPTPGQETIVVPCTSLDDFACTETIPDFIKCDVEGAEYEVFMGAQRVLAEHRPLVACEVHSDQNAAQLTELFDKLRYSLRWFTKNHFLASPPGLP